ncbi:MAG: c-type cytochrome [Thiohalorhabdus sp.]|uniref:c-type cytochrome n=1 Tax=Thiohalorhabdus sp. TaxID=3094134 RepID=UPI00397F4503
MRHASVWLGLGAALVAVGPAMAQSQGDPVAGEDKAYQCMGCHGEAEYTNAYPTYNVPKVGGQQAQYIVSALEAYQNGDREHPTMQSQARSLSEEDIQDIAAFFAQGGS